MMSFPRHGASTDSVGRLPVRRATSVAVMLASLVSATAASAQAPHLVVRGTVIGADSRWDATSTLYTYVTLDVTSVVVGDGVPSRIVIKQLGGERDGIGLWVAGQAAFSANEDVLLDLDAAPDGTLRTRALARGKWRVEVTGPGVMTASQPSANGAAVSMPIDLVTAVLDDGAALAGFTAVPAEFSGPRQPGPLFAYLPTDGGYPARWHEVDDRGRVFVDFAPIPSTWTHATSSHQSEAVNLWRTSGMDLDLQAGVSYPSGQCPALSFTGNGRIAVAYNDPCAGNVNDWVIGGGYYTTGDLRTVNGTTFQKFLQGFVVLDDSGPQAASAGCFRDAVTHGLGHALGLGHTTSGGAIMNAGPPATCAAGPSGLGADDRAGITSIYRGVPSGGFPPDTPTAFSATAALSTVTLAWTPASTGGQAQRFLIDAGTAPSTYNLGTLTVNAPATSTSVGSVPTGTYYVRVRAQNLLGTSAPSPERAVTVGACTLPGAPPSLTGSASDTLVNLQWTPPTSGVVQGYRLVAGSAPGISNLATLDFAGAVTTLSAEAPYGTYFVRVHATNVCGLGPPSPEMTLLVQPCTAAPSAPTGLSSTVTGATVTLAWTAGAGAPASSYTLSVGSATGLSNLLVLPTGTRATTFTAQAPAGRYFVRIAATNACGTSGPSNEVVVVVP
jgi:Matrixin